MDAKIKDGMKYCGKCSTWKTLADFPKSSQYRNGYHSHCKECHHARYVARKTANPGLFREYNRSNYVRHRDHFLKRAHTFYHAHRDHYRRYFALRTQDPTFRRAENERANRRNRLNPEPSRARARFRKALYRGANGGKPFDRFKIAERDNWICHLCGLHIALSDFSIDHLIPISKGGPHTEENVAAAHLLCNIRRQAKPLPVR